MKESNLSFNLSVIITKQNKRFVAYTPALDICTSGKTEKEVKTRFVELANIFLEELVEMGTTNEVLFELGWTKVQKKWTPPKIVSSPYINLSIPVLVK
jgi:hypothetical protein